TSVKTGRIMQAILLVLWSAEIETFVEVAQDTGGHAPNVALAERHGVVAADHALPVAAVQRVVLHVHQEGERHFEGFIDLRAVEREPMARIDARHRRQDAKTAERQIEIEISD